MPPAFGFRLNGVRVKVNDE